MACVVGVYEGRMPSTCPLGHPTATGRGGGTEGRKEWRVEEGEEDEGRNELPWHHTWTIFSIIVHDICWQSASCTYNLIYLHRKQLKYNNTHYKRQRLFYTCCGARSFLYSGTCGRGRLWKCPPPSWSTATLYPGWTSGCLPTLQ